MEQLLKLLEDNARLPIEDIATMLNKSPAEVAAMIDLARAQGIIKGYKTLVDWEKAGVNRVGQRTFVRACCITLTPIAF